MPELLGGSIKSNTPQVLYGASAGLISNVTAPSGGGEGSYTYQWEQSTLGSTWRAITGATGLTYSTPSLTEQTSYRRKVTSKNQTAYSNVVTIKVVSSDLATDQNYIQTRTMQNESGTVYQDRIDYYDGLGRPVVTGIWPSVTVPDVSGLVVKSSRNPQDLKLGGYTVSNLSLPSTVKLLTVNYYDDYSFISGMTQLDYATPPSGYGTRHSSAKGQPTGSRAYRLDDPSKYTVSAVYYDHRGRVVQTRSTNHLGGYDHEYTGYTFTGKVTQRMQVHSAPNKTTQTEVLTYTYDHAERLLSVTHKLNSAAQVTLAQYTYDEVGRAKTKKLGTETTTYSYNVRGWLNRISGTKFNQTLAYNTAVNGVTPSTPRYNGNISAMRWKSGDETSERGYQYTYDNLSRLTLAKYGEGTNISANPDRFNEKLTYDKMGNITTLERQGKLDGGYGLMDKLSYTYTGNRLTKVTDAVSPSITYANAFQFVDRANVANEYAYDANGNLTKDLNKNITSITYNSLNLPSVITFTNGNTITYVYDASGSKLSVAYKSGSTTTKTEYSGNKVYKNGTLSMILTEEGFTTLSGTTPTYYYYLKDHQGNNRVVINQSGTVQQVNHYYAFGGQFGEGMQSSNQPYKYNGKELDRFQGLDLYDYGARHYDAALGRWFTVDPLAEKYYSISSYVYVGNNPANIIDINGMDWYWDKDGTRQYDPNITSQKQLEEGQTYIGIADIVRNEAGAIIENYRKDGSIMYSKESDAYARMILQSDRSGNESMVALTNKGSLVLPDYKNTSSSVDITDYGYSIKNSNIVDATGTEYNTIATAHTHPGGGGPSIYVVTGYGDLGFAAGLTPYKPVYVLQMGKDVVSLIVSAPKGYSTGKYIDSKLPNHSITGLLKGDFSLRSLTETLDFKKILK